MTAAIMRLLRLRRNLALRGVIAAAALVPLVAILCGAAKPPTPLDNGPIAYFNAKCARCHGKYGSFYGEDFGRKLTDRQLRKVVADMAEGPSQAPLAQPELDAQVAFHRALIARQPFLSWTEKSAGSVSGEVTPGARVSATVGGKTVEAQLSRGSWSVRLPASTGAFAVKVSASTGKTTVTLDLGQSTFTHAAPLAR
jgi:hypothetical protein